MEELEKQHTQIKTLSTTITQTIASPYPPATELEGYERVLPGAADRIFKLVESESLHRRELEQMALEKEAKDGLLGLIFSFVISLLCIGSGSFLIYSGYSIAGSVFGMSGAASITYAFLRTRPKKQETTLDSNEQSLNS